MRISELIEQLEQEMAEAGDIDVRVVGHDPSDRCAGESDEVMLIALPADNIGPARLLIRDAVYP